MLRPVEMGTRITLLLAVSCSAALAQAGDGTSDSKAVEKTSEAKAARLTTRELAQWLDERFGRTWQERKVQPAPAVDDATFLRRVYLDLQGTIPSVAQTRDFLANEAAYKREDLVERLLKESAGLRAADRSAEHLARVWRRVLVPGNGPGAGMAIQMDPWLKSQFSDNVHYDEFARKLLTAKPDALANQTTPGPFTPPSGPLAFYQAVGGTPESLANAFTRVFLGVRIGCAQCHNHPFADWKQEDFWGVAAFFAGARSGPGMSLQEVKLTKIKPENGSKEYDARFLWGDEPKFPDDKTPREVLAEWMVSPQNPNFASTAVNRVWQYLCGRGMTVSVDDLDQANAEERRILDDLAKLFVAADHDIRWLITGVCQSQVYQRASVAPGKEKETTATAPGTRPLKTLLPEQVFDSLEQALALPVSRADNGPRHNGQMNQLLTRLNESLGTTPEEFRGGIPQTLLLMNGQLTAKATDLNESRTLRAVVDAPFLKTEQKLDTLYLAAFTRLPSDEERQFLLDHVRQYNDKQKQKEAFAEIFWSLLNSPEFVLSR